MEVVHERSCGLDVHKKNVVACVITPAGRQVRSFGTMTRDLLQMLGWLEVCCYMRSVTSAQPRAIARRATT